MQYEERAIRATGLVEHAGWRLKAYGISHDGSPPGEEDFGGGVRLALAALPRPAAAVGRPGVGFLISHRGRTADYVVLGWWDRHNEMPVRVFVREPDAAWRPSREGESFCVWDLQVMWFEREAFVGTVMSDEHPDPVAAYLGRILDSRVGAGEDPGA